MSPLAQQLGSLEEVISTLRRECEESIERSRRNSIERMNETIANVERNRPIIAMLEAEKLPIRVSTWIPGNVYLELGFFPYTKKASADLADKLRRIRRILDCRLGLPSKSLLDGKERRLEFTLTPEGAPGVRIEYSRKLPKGCRCKIVTERRSNRRLVCEV